MLAHCSCSFVDSMFQEGHEFELHGPTNMVIEKLFNIELSTNSDLETINF